MEINIKLLHVKATLPTYATDGSGAFDLYASAYGEVASRGSQIFDTGISVKIPDGHTMLVFSRSGHGFKYGLRLSNCVGVIDSDYTGEIKIKLHNDTAIPYYFTTGDRIAQALIVATPKVQFVQVDHLEATDRGDRGFGSTGEN